MAGILLLEELVEAFDNQALSAILGAVQRRILEAAQAKAAGRQGWWKVRPNHDLTTPPGVVILTGKQDLYDHYLNGQHALSIACF